MPLILGLLALGWGLACLALCASFEGPSVGLSALAPPELVLMSCDQALGSAAYSALGTLENDQSSDQSPEPLWCENPDSPHCLPGNPAPPRHEPWLTPFAGMLPALSATGSTRVWSARSSWPRPHATRLRSYADDQRLERPPRAV